MKKGLVVDAGNTRLKAAVYEEGVLVSDVVVFSYDNHLPLQTLLETEHPTHTLLSSVTNHPEALLYLLNRYTKTIILSTDVLFPFKNEYATPQTLGMDRAAGIAGALQLFPDQNCLVIDAGTCVTFDFVTSDNRYLGGAISPGLNMRLQAMHTFTQKLPELRFEEPSNYIGDSTKGSMLSGAYFGLLGEINDTIARYEEQFGEVQVILCGGDGVLFDKRTKKSIFAAPDLVLHGLYKILQLNAT
ncbi:MAG: type III pantothenate kinase [Bacteroidota bacterium]